MAEGHQQSVSVCLRKSHPGLMILHKTTVIIVEKDGKILLTRRGDEPEKGKWAVPGGHLDAGESFSQAAQREANEEVGDVKVESKPIFDFVHHVPPGEDVTGGKPHKHHCQVFMAKPTGELKAGTDAAEIDWFTPEQAKKLKLTAYTETILKHMYE